MRIVHDALAEHGVSAYTFLKHVPASFISLDQLAPTLHVGEREIVAHIKEVAARRRGGQQREEEAEVDQLDEVDGEEERDVAADSGAGDDQAVLLPVATRPSRRNRLLAPLAVEWPGLSEGGE